MTSDCRLTIGELHMTGVYMPDTSAAGSLSDRIMAATGSRLIKTQSILRSRFERQADCTAEDK